MHMTTVNVVVLVAMFLSAWIGYGRLVEETRVTGTINHVGCHGFDPMTSQPTLRSNVTFPKYGHRNPIFVSSMIRLPERNQLLVGVNTIGSDLPLTLISLDEGTVETLDEREEDVSSLALLSTGEVVISGTASGMNYVHVLDIQQEPAQVIDEIFVGREYTSCCHIVCPGPSENTFLLAGYNHLDPTGSFIDLMSRDGQVIDTLVEGAKMMIDHMSLHNQHIYLSGLSLAKEDEPESNLMVFNLDNRTLSHHIGSLNLTGFGKDFYFYQGDCDENGTLYIAAHNSEDCYLSMNSTETCCMCVMIITPEGNMRMFVPPNNRSDIEGVVMTPSGMAVSWEVTDNSWYRKAMVQFYDML